MSSLTCGPVDVAVSIVLGDPDDPTLVLPPECDEHGIWWNDLGEPAWDLRLEYAPPSAQVPGQVLLSAVEDLASLPLRVAVKGTTLAQMLLRRETVTAALRAWPGTVTLTATVDGGEPVVYGGPWQSFPAIPTWGKVDLDLLGLFVCEGAVSLPVNPPGAP